MAKLIKGRFDNNLKLGDALAEIRLSAIGGNGGNGGTGGQGGHGAQGYPGRDATQYSCGTGSEMKDSTFF